MNWLVDFNIDSRPRLALSNGENRRSLTASVLELFKKHWSTLYFEMDNSTYELSFTTIYECIDRKKLLEKWFRCNIFNFLRIIGNLIL